MDQINAIRWGGLRRRYVDFPGAVSRCLDPFARATVQFQWPLEFEAWIRSRFATDTAQLTSEPTRVCANVAGRLLEAKATFVVKKIDGREVLHLVGKHSVSKGRLRSLTSIAKGRLATVQVQLIDELRADVALFWRLERLRQAATIYLSEGFEYDTQILQCINSNGAATRSAIHAALGHADPQLLDARLAHLHCARRIRLDFECDNFGISRVGGAQ